MSRPTRRVVLQSAAGAFAGLALVGNASPVAAQDLVSSDKSPATVAAKLDVYHGLKIGVASYSLRGLKLDACIAGIQRVGMKFTSIKENHLPLKSSTDERKAVAAKFRAAGITPLSCGNIQMENDEANVRNTFEYARDIGAPTIVCNPHPDSFPILDKMVKEFRDIKLAIHNHGPESDRYKSPYDAMKAAEKYDERIGLCIDVGHTARMNVDPVEAIHKCAARLYDVHLKDISQVSRRNSEVEIGRGILNIRAILQALLDVKFAHHAGIEHEKDGKDPVPGLAESVGYVRGIMAYMPR